MWHLSVCDFYASSRGSVPLKQVLEITVWLCNRKTNPHRLDPGGIKDVEWMEKDACVTPHPPKKNPGQKHSSHDSRLSFHVNRLIKAQHQSVSGTFAAGGCAASYAIPSWLRPAGWDDSWKSLMIQQPVTFTQWHPCMRHRETAHPSHRGLETQLNHLTYKRHVNGGMMWLRQGRRYKKKTKKTLSHKASTDCTHSPVLLTLFLLIPEIKSILTAAGPIP